MLVDSNGNCNRWDDPFENFHGNHDGDGDHYGDNHREEYNSGGGMAIAMA